MQVKETKSNQNAAVHVHISIWTFAIDLSFLQEHDPSSQRHLSLPELKMSLSGRAFL